MLSKGYRYLVDMPQIRNGTHNRIKMKRQQYGPYPTTEDQSSREI